MELMQEIILGVDILVLQEIQTNMLMSAVNIQEQHIK